MAIRSDVVGSLLRPPELVEAREAYEAGRLGPAAFKSVEDRAVDDAVALQEDAGLDVVTRRWPATASPARTTTESSPGRRKPPGWCRASERSGSCRR